MTPYKSLYTEAKITEKYKLFIIKFARMNYIKILYSLHYKSSYYDDEKLDMYQSLIEYFKSDKSNRTKNDIIERYNQYALDNNNTIDESVIPKLENEWVTDIEEQVYTLKSITKIIDKNTFGIEWEHPRYIPGSQDNDNYVDLLNTIYYIGFLEGYDYDSSKGYIRNTKRVSNQSLYDEFKSKSRLDKPIRVWIKE